MGKKNNVEVTTSKELLSSATVDQLKDYDGVTIMQFGKLENDVYPKLESYGIKQIAHENGGQLISNACHGRRTHKHPNLITGTK